MAYIRHDENNNPVSPQPGATDVTIYDGTEGWSTISYKRWNGDYVARNPDNTPRTPGTYQARNVDNSPRTPAAYQRHDENNNPISA